MLLEAPPPARHISSNPISVSAASSMLETYLSNSQAHPHLHPDAHITPTGVTFSSHGGAMGSVVMHNLRRVAAGLRGEYLEPEKTPEPEDDAEDERAGRKKGGRKRKEVPVEDWQDKEVYDLEEGTHEIGEAGPRTNVVQDGGEEPEVEITGGEVQESGKKRKTDAGGVDESKMSKEERKKAKKARSEQRKKENEKKRAGKA
ncbi:hypothetical protein FB567DRAFT_451381 [Paraphoma chrysanthemicola]|uniref:Uncharacterized protein n=1 Tax=Paraphoma chrysanthemicola TaxID=798071 RepID=A0A8K0QY36_9PLEO|nr:hypothetical protein FB567DRAFT_451381 [Paraphoma chrysanthemicola]